MGPLGRKRPWEPRPQILLPVGSRLRAEEPRALGGRDGDRGWGQGLRPGGEQGKGRKPEVLGERGGERCGGLGGAERAPGGPPGSRMRPRGAGAGAGVRPPSPWSRAALQEEAGAGGAVGSSWGPSCPGPTPLLGTRQLGETAPFFPPKTPQTSRAGIRCAPARRGSAPCRRAIPRAGSACRELRAASGSLRGCTSGWAGEVQLLINYRGFAAAGMLRCRSLRAAACEGQRRCLGPQSPNSAAVPRRRRGARLGLSPVGPKRFSL